MGVPPPIDASSTIAQAVVYWHFVKLLLHPAWDVGQSLSWCPNSKEDLVNVELKQSQSNGVGGGVCNMELRGCFSQNGGHNGMFGGHFK